MSKGNILVTGGAGYIGSHTCKALANAGYTPVVYDNLSHGYLEFVKWGPLEVGYILDSKRLYEVFQKYEPDAVMHFAGLISAGESVEKPDLYYKTNVEGSQTLIDVTLKNRVTKFIFSSTAAVYGNPEQVPIPETHTLKPVNPYGETKLSLENLLKNKSEAGLLSVIALRYFNAAGADP